MGLETTCRARVDDRSGTVRDAESKVLLETDELIVRGEARIRIPRASIQQVTARAGVVTITSPTAIVSLTLGDAAPTWRAKLEEPPKRLIDKLDVKPDARVWLLGVHDETLMAQLAERTSKISKGRSASGCDAVFVGVDSAKDLERIPRALEAIHDDGMIWVIHRKGKDGVLDTEVFGTARPLGLVDTKVARVSDTHSGIKLVRPRASRGAAVKAKGGTGASRRAPRRGG